ncbi:hypothetical protein BP6252_09422 [Coleophoma cylindrospora]|uniref:C3H1-type domain-containing protein n=1 Tax=Coleophoma cylindrospora TaxID=1849047 RepID=A0A3D8R220_9HELO|nr:hypothetical protein BP6252_09422 [Coleophoma cylindrospora]
MLSNGAPPLHRNSSISSDRVPEFMASQRRSLSIPNGLAPQNGSSNGNGNGNGVGQPQQMPGPMGGPRFDGPRSPPNKQNTSHVPCKFFRQGACQAGKACPFSHDLASTTDNVCKYFAKGNCKFGGKCANIHVLPDGRRVNYNRGGPMGISVGPMPGAGHLNLGGRVPPDPYRGQASNLTSSFIGANGVPPSTYGQQYSPFANADEPFRSHQQSIDISVPTIDTSYVSHPGSNYGSPRDEDLSRFGLGLSPVAGKGLSVLDAPLPASFDSNGVSWIARHGPMASSVPAQFGIESPPQSLGEVRDGRTSEALKNLHSSAFGDDTRDRFNGIASSPPAGPAEEYFGKRVMHSQRYPRAKMMSASLPKAVDKDWDAEFTYEEDYLPEALKDLMTDQEKARRGSRTATDEEGRPIHSGTGTPSNETTSKFGSPSNGSGSPSRFHSLFQKHHQQREEEERSRVSAFGHVGSPLRNSSLTTSITPSPSQRSISRPNTSASGDSSPYVASPPRQNSMSIIAQQLQRTRLSRAENNATDPGLHPVSAVRNSSNPIGSGRTGERQLSSSSIGTGRFTTPIDEEQGDFVFSMEEDENQSKRNSGGWTYTGGKGSPNLGPIGNGNKGGTTS